MRRVLAVLTVSLFLSTPSFGDEVVFPDGTTSNMPGGLMVIRKGNQTTWALGGGIFSRHVKVVTNTPEGKIVARFKMPSVLHDPYPAPLPTAAPALLHVEIPDPYALIFIEGELVRTTGASRDFESPRLPPGKAYPVRVRAAFVVGKNFLVEDKEVLLKAGENSAVTFDGSKAISVPLPKDAVKR